MSHQIVYVVRHTVTGLHKIGITNSWERRKKELEVGTKTTPLHVARVNDARQVEKFLHKRFSISRIPQTEWFHLDEEQLAFVRAIILKAKDDFNRTNEEKVPRLNAGIIHLQPRQNTSIVEAYLQGQKTTDDYIGRVLKDNNAEKQSQRRSSENDAKASQDVDSKARGKAQSHGATKQRLDCKSILLKQELLKLRRSRQVDKWTAEAREKLLREKEIRHWKYTRMPWTVLFFLFSINNESRINPGVQLHFYDYLAFGVVAVLLGWLFGGLTACLTARFSFNVLRRQ